MCSVFTLCNSAVGVGVLLLPYAFRHAGLGSSLILAVLIAGLEGLTLYVLAKFAERHHSKSYSSLVRMHACCHQP